jgi:CAAX prenyl protease-like protein
MFERDSWPRILPFGAYIVFIFIADTLGRAGVPAPQLRWLYAAKIVIVLALLIFHRRRYTELRWSPLSTRVLGVAVVSGVVVWVLWINLNAGWMTIGGSAGFDFHSNGRIDWLLVAIRLAGAALVVPVMEELFWRSFLMRWLVDPDFLRVDPARCTWMALTVTTILFGFEHSLWLAGIAAGAVYSVLYLRSRTLWPSVIAHGVTNGLLGVWIISTNQWTYW